MITQKHLKEVLNYNPTTGIFTWINCGSKKRNKKIAGTICKDGYRSVRVDNISYQSGRLAFLYMEGYFPEHEVDHKDRNRANDKWNNLRHVSRQCNMRNCSIGSLNTSGVKGVWWHKDRKKWTVGIKINLKQKHIGCFVDFDEAVCCRLAAEQCLDWSDCDSSSTAFQYVKNMLLR